MMDGRTDGRKDRQREGMGGGVGWQNLCTSQYMAAQLKQEIR